MHWRRKWQPTPVFLPGESQGQRSLVGCCLLDRTELDTTEATYQQEEVEIKFTPKLSHPRIIQITQFSSVTQSCPTLCDPMNCSMPGLPVHHKLLEFTQTHIHRVGDAIQPSHPLSSPSPPVPNPSQHQSLFQ